MSYPHLTDDDAPRCGMGKAAQCCAYLTAGAGGFACGRADAGIKAHVEHRVAAQTMNARRLPQADYPACQSEGTVTA